MRSFLPHTRPVRFLRSAQVAVASVLMLCSAVIEASAQKPIQIGSKFVLANVATAYRSGRFGITSGPYWGDPVNFLFSGGDNSFLTSNLVFRIARGGGVTYYHNQPPGLGFSWAPTPMEPVTATFKAYDSVYVSPARDTLAYRYSQMAGYTVIVRFIVEKPSTEYDDGSDLLMEFSYSTAYPGLDGELGIMMMLDTYNSQAVGSGGQDDKPSVLTSIGYHAEGIPNNSRRYNAPVIPEWYHVGNFTLNTPMNTLFPIHRLSGKSHGGAPLNAPQMFAIGNWYDLRSVAWDLPSSFASSSFGDCATVTRWEGLAGSGTVRTAFGVNDKSGNQNFTCRDDDLFVDIRTSRVVEQDVEGGAYKPAYVDVDMWVTNLSQLSGMTPTIRLQSPLPSLPGMRNDRLILDASTPASQSVYVPTKGVGRLHWRLNINPASPDTVVQLMFYVKQNLAKEHPFAEGCTPRINVRGWMPPPPPHDTLPPVVRLTGSGRNSTVYWDFNVFDRHPGYIHDTGLRNPFTIVAATNVNFTVTPTAFDACDTTETVAVHASVIDTSRNASFSFRAFDCFGNSTLETVGFSPRPDTFPPEDVVVRRVGPPGPDCQAREYEILLRDETHQTPTYGDHGFGSVDVLVANNFRYTINDGQPITPFQGRVTMVISVIDSMIDGDMMVRVLDFAGNQRILNYSYCTMPDVLPPLATATPTGTGTWRVDVSDSRAWDRGLREIIETANPGNNMIMSAPPVFNPGDRSVTFTVEAIDLFQLGDITLEIRDMIYATTPEDHFTSVRILYEPGTLPPEDTIAPNIIFTPVPGTGGAVADVEVNDIHYIDGVLYAYDKGLKTVDVIRASSNIRLRTPISFSVADRTMRFQIEVVDTLTIGTLDSIVVAASDLADNASSETYYYPIMPDVLAPILIGSIDDGRTALTLDLTDKRAYDRGLGDVTIESPTNIAGSPVQVRGNQATASFPVLDPNAPISGVVVLRDLMGTILSTPQDQAAHTLRIPFSLSVVNSALRMPFVVEGGEDVYAPILAVEDFGSDVQSISIELAYNGPVATPTLAWRRGSLTQTQLGGGRILIEAAPGGAVTRGDTLGVLRFGTSESRDLHQLNISTIDYFTNGRQRTQILARRDGDTAISALSIPPPLMRLAIDSVAYINGTCERVLVSRGVVTKSRALEIVAFRPQPVVRSNGLNIELDLRNLPTTGASAELLTLEGSAAAVADISGGDQPLVRRRITFDRVPQGTYVLRLTATTGSASQVVMIVE